MLAALCGNTFCMRAVLSEHAIGEACKSPIASCSLDAPSSVTNTRNLTVSGKLSGLFRPGRVALRPGRRSPPVHWRASTPATVGCSP